MYELLIERPRGGAGWGRRWPRVNWRCLDQTGEGRQDGGPIRQRMKPRSPSKWLSENLAPLCRFLQRRVGRPWNEVHSEICAHIAVRSAVQKHVLDHLWHYVERNPVMIDGRPHHARASRGMYHPLSGYRYSFYVCPVTGRLLQLREGRIRRRAAGQDAVG